MINDEVKAMTFATERGPIKVKAVSAGDEPPSPYMVADKI